MAVYVDNERIPWRGKLWCHLVADSLEELHQFAAKLNLQRHWFQCTGRFPHYDVTISVRERALAMGAVAAGKRETIAAARKLREEFLLLQEAEAEMARVNGQQAALFG